MSDNIPTSRLAGFFDKNAWWYLSAALMLAVVLGLVAIFMLPSDDKKTSDNAGDPVEPSGTAPLSSAPTSPNSSGAEGTPCNASKGPRSIPALAPPATWEPLGPFSVPLSDEFGPTKVNGSIRECYQHTPTGALFAALNIPYAIATSSAEEYSKVVTELVTPGPARDAMLETGQVEASEGIFNVIAYRFDSCSATQCNLRFVAASTGVLVEIPTTVVWTDGDWHVDGASTSGGAGPVDSVPPGFVSFGAGV